MVGGFLGSVKPWRHARSNVEGTGMGNLPPVFHKFNTKDEEVRKEKASKKLATETLEPAVQATADKITAFLKEHDASTK